MKAGWRVVPLGEVCEFRRGLTYSKGDEVDSGGTAVLRAMNIDLETGELDLSDIRYIAPAVDVPRSKMVEAGTLLLCTASGSKKHLGKAALIDRPMDFAFGGFMGLLVPSNSILPNFLHWVMRSDAYWAFIDGLSSGTNINNLKFSQLSAFPVPLPPLDEQKRIVAVLDEAFEGLSRARANAEANLADARELFDRMHSSSFEHPSSDWATRNLSDVCEKITDGTHQTPNYFDAGHVFLSSRNVTSGRIDWDDVKFIDDKQHAEMQKRVSPRRGDVLLAKNGTTGVAAIVDRDISFDIYVSLALLRPKTGLLPELLLQFVNSSEAKQQFNGRLKGSGVPNLHLKEIREVVISYPQSEIEQRDLVARIKEIMTAKAEVEKVWKSKRGLIDTLRQSLLQKAFSGELT